MSEEEFKNHIDLVKDFIEIYHRKIQKYKDKNVLHIAKWEYDEQIIVTLIYEHLKEYLEFIDKKNKDHLDIKKMMEHKITFYLENVIKFNPLKKSTNFNSNMFELFKHEAFKRLINIYREIGKGYLEESDQIYKITEKTLGYIF